MGVGWLPLFGGFGVTAMSEAAAQALMR